MTVKASTKYEVILEGQFVNFADNATIFLRKMYAHFLIFFSNLVDWNEVPITF